MVMTIAAADSSAQTIPTIDTEDASLGSLAVGGGRFHPTLSLDLRNGDFARGGYDDDAASLDRLPVHVQLGFGYDLHRAADGKTDLWLVGASSNGVHSPGVDERVSPRGWYESNSLIGLVGTAGKGLTIGTAYAIKTSPNGVSGTSHEASVTVAYESETGLGALHPSAAATVRPKGGHGLFTQVGIEPQFAIGPREDGPTVSVPAVLGIGWGGFYEAGTGSVTYGSIGLAYTYPFVIGATHWRWRIDGLALVRDDTLRRIGSLDAERSAVVPLVTIGLTTAF